MTLHDHERFLHGIDLFNRGAWFEAHEVWETLWRQAEGPRRAFLQGLIQAAVALEHARRGNVRGARRMLERCQKRLRGLPPVMAGVPIQTLLTDLEQVLAPRLEGREAAPPPSLAELGSVRITLHQDRRT